MIPASLVASLGSFGVVATSVAASFVLEEKLNLVGKMASVLTMVGNLVAIIHAPRVSIKKILCGGSGWLFNVRGHVHITSELRGR